MTDNAAGWQADPTGRHDHRYWDGSQWTDHVSDAGVASTDAFEPGSALGDAGPSEADDLRDVDEPTAATPTWDDPTVTQPAAPSDTTAAWPAAPPPPVPPTPAGAGPVGPESGGSKRGLLIGGGVLAAVVLAVVAFLLLGGDDDDSSDVETRLAAQIKSESDGQLTDEQADCVAGHIVDEIGADRMEDVDFDADDPPAGMEDELIAASFGAIAACDIDPAALGGGGDVDEGGSDEGGSDEGGSDAGEDGEDGEGEDDEGDGSSGDGTYGSDAELDALYDACEEGDYQACDDLFLESPSDSEYEEFGDTCGGRNEPSGYCVELYEGEDADDDPPVDVDVDAEEMLADIYEESLGLDRDKAECLAERLADAIESGDMSESEAMSDVFSYLEDCDISMEEIGN